MHIGVDIGGTNLAIGLVNDKYEILHKEKCKTNTQSGEKMCKDIVDLINETLTKTSISIFDIESIGIGCPGHINSKDGIIEYSPNLKLKKFHIRETLQKTFQKNISVNNDANVAAYGEYIAGAASANSITMTLGTGIGTGIILGGKIFTGCNNAAGEAGHMVIHKGGRKCNCGRLGCFEQYASVSGIKRTTREILEAHNKNDTIIWDMIKYNTNNIKGRTPFDAMQQGDIVGKKIVDTFIDDLACGTINLINILQPEVICIGGGLSNEGENLLSPLRERIQLELGDTFSNNTKILKAKLGNDAGIIGAAFCQ